MIHRQLRSAAADAPGKLGVGRAVNALRGVQDENATDALVLESLIEKLYSRGSKQMAIVCLNCGNTELIDAAVHWAESHGYSITRRPGTSLFGWGSW